MIERITTSEQLSVLPEKGIESQKIRALLNAYGVRYDFCRFFKQGDSCCIAVFGASVVICGVSNDYGELAEFLQFSGVADIFCSSECGMALSELLPFAAESVNIMRFCGALEASEVNDAPALSEVYDIVSRSFDIDFEPWYLDMSHRVRHDVSLCFVLDNSSACVLQHDINGEALISQVATLPERRGEGLASRLIKEVCRRCEGSDIFVICEGALLVFYEMLGFEKCGECVVLAKCNIARYDDGSKNT